MPSSRGSSHTTALNLVCCVFCVVCGFFIAEPLGNPTKIILNNNNNKLGCKICRQADLDVKTGSTILLTISEI